MIKGWEIWHCKRRKGEVIVENFLKNIDQVFKKAICSYDDLYVTSLKSSQQGNHVVKQLYNRQLLHVQYQKFVVKFSLSLLSFLVILVIIFSFPIVRRNIGIVIIQSM